MDKLIEFMDYFTRLLLTLVITNSKKLKKKGY